MSGKVIIFSAPSGAGKSTIVNHLLGKYPELEFSISATSRAPRGDEQDGREYYFFTADQFRRMIAEDKFVEHEEVYPGSFYGTLKSEVERIWAAPSVEILRERLISRGTDSAEAIGKRVAKASSEMEFAKGRFDYVLVNDDLQTALDEADEIVGKFLAK